MDGGTMNGAVNVAGFLIIFNPTLGSSPDTLEFPTVRGENLSAVLSRVFSFLLRGFVAGFVHSSVGGWRAKVGKIRFSFSRTAIPGFTGNDSRWLVTLPSFVNLSSLKVFDWQGKVSVIMMDDDP